MKYHTDHQGASRPTSQESERYKGHPAAAAATASGEKLPSADRSGRRHEAANVDVALSVRDLHVDLTSSHGSQIQVLGGIDLGAHDAEFVSVIGPSGCGKSTLLNVVAGFQAPTSGTVTFRGAAVTSPGADRGMVFQKPALYPWLTVLENVLFGPKATGRRAGARQRALSLLDEVGLSEFATSRTYELSGGMQHRVSLARTLINEPPLLLMDEPFAALDAQTRTAMQALLLRVWESHRPTVLFVTHDIEEGLLLADRVVVLTNRPATVKAVRQVPFSRPRSYDLVLDPEFVAMRGEIRGLVAPRREAIDKPRSA